MKVLMIITHPEFGGTETHVLSLSTMMRKYGIRVGVATYGGPFVPIIRRQGVPVHKIGKTRRSSSAAAASNVSLIVKKHRYDVIHAHDIESFRMLPYLYKQLPNIPRVMTVHGIYYSRTELRRAAGAANLVIAVSPTVRRRVIHSGSSENRVRWIPNGIDVHKYSPVANPARYKRILHLPKKSKICLYVGRFQSDKWNIARKLILASERLARKNTNFNAVLVGFGSYRNRLVRLAKRVNERLGRIAIYVLPPTTRVENYYRAATLVVGTGRVALEAMSCGKPVIAAGLAGYEGMVVPKTLSRSISNQFGDHAAPRHISIPRLSNDIDRLLTHPDLCKFLGNYGRKIVLQRFSIQRVATITRNAYLRV
jgi:glycosyltransferase involved in cell wall biosynthesis